MSLLDELKEEAGSLLQKQQVTREEFNQNLLLAHSKLKDVLHYWVELFTALNVIKPIILRTYHLEGAIKLENLKQGDYNVNGRRLTVDHKEYIEAIVLRFRSASQDKLTIEKQSEPLVQRMRDHLWMNNLKFDLKEIRSDRGYIERGIFSLAPEVPVAITISANLETAQIKIVAKNLERFGEYTYTYDYDEFTNEIMEELGKIILDKPNKFRTMGKHQAAVRTTPTPAPQAMPSAVRAVPPIPSTTDESADTVKNFFGNIKTILKG